MAEAALIPLAAVNSQVLSATTSYQAVYIPASDTVLIQNAAASVCTVAVVGGTAVYVLPNSQLVIAGTASTREALIELATGTGNIYITTDARTAF